jgi:nucleoside-diphosphate-sugar epimerase
MSTALPQILLIGATGRTGSLVLAEALSRGHTVTILIRKTSDSLPRHDNLTTVIGDPCMAADVEKALRATRSGLPVVIISTLGQTRTSGNPWAAATSPPRFMAASAKAVLAAVQSPSVADSVQVQKLVVMSMFGAGDSFAQLNFLMRWTMNHSNMDVTLEDQNLVDETVKAGGLPFVLVRPAMLRDGEAASVKVHGDDGQGAGFMPSVTVKSVAAFLLDAAVRDEFDGKTPMICN